MDATVISRYAGMGGATASVAAEPQRDLLHHAKSAAPQVMTDALAHIPIRSDTRLSADNFHFISAVESDPASRMEPACGSDWLASLASLPTLRELAGISGGCQGVTLSRRIFARAPMGNVPTLDRRSGQRFLYQHPDGVKR